jgi:hypothetical protein
MLANKLTSIKAKQTAKQHVPQHSSWHDRMKASRQGCKKERMLACLQEKPLVSNIACALRLIS